MNVPQRATPPQRTRIDWGVAKAWYVGLRPEERSYEAVSREFRVSVTTVRKWARRDKWAEAARAADAKAAAAALKTTERSRSRVARDTALIHVASQDELRRRLTETPAAMSDADLVRAYRESGHQFRLDVGEATGRIEAPEVADLVQTLLLRMEAKIRAVVEQFVPPAKVGVALDAGRQGLLDAAEEAAANLPSDTLGAAA